MRSIFAVLLLAYLCNAKPMQNLEAPVVSVGKLGIDNYIIGGSDATAGEWPWQLSQQRCGAVSCSHSCGASLLGSTKVLSAAHCVDGAQASALKIIAGLHDRDNMAGTSESDVSRIVMHEEYDNNQASFANDIAILHLATVINTGGNIQYATLPPNNNDNFAGDTCMITGWGRTSSSQALPNTLQEAPIQVITTSECQGYMNSVSGATIWDNHICLYDTSNNRGSCNGDSGGPLNCPYSGGHYVAGVTSWGISNILGNCLQTYPSVYTRTSTYLAWISSH